MFHAGNHVMNKLLKWVTVAAASIFVMIGMGDAYKYVYWRAVLSPVEDQLSACMSFDEATNTLMSVSHLDISDRRVGKLIDCKGRSDGYYPGRIFSCKFTWCKYFKPASETIFVVERAGDHKFKSCRTTVDIFRFRVPMKGAVKYDIGDDGTVSSE